MNSITDHLSDEQKKEFKPVAIEMKKGYGTFHHPLLLHGSNENRSDNARRATVLNVFADGTKSASDAPLLKGINSVAEGHQMDGRFFPLLYTPDKNGSNL